MVAVTLLLVGMERIFHVGIFDPAPRGRPHPVPASVLVLFAPGRSYIMILPAMGVISEASVACFTRKRAFSDDVVAMASVAIAIFGFLVWRHHMFVSGQSV